MEREKGFTLIELLITIIIISILLATGVPAFLDFIKNNRLTAQTNEFVTAIQLARSEAVKRGTNTIVCASINGTSCSDNKNDWSKGWIVFSDLNQNDDPDTGASAPLCEEAEDCLMRTGNGLSNNTTISATAANAVAEHTLRFLPTGLASNAGIVTFTLEAADCHINQKRTVQITLQGHTVISNATC
ncbi:MAG: GspH/FimT family protein [Pseudomonadota bacterium]